MTNFLSDKSSKTCNYLQSLFSFFHFLVGGCHNVVSADIYESMGPTVDIFMVYNNSLQTLKNIGFVYYNIFRSIDLHRLTYCTNIVTQLNKFNFLHEEIMILCPLYEFIQLLFKLCYFVFDLILYKF